MNKKKPHLYLDVLYGPMDKTTLKPFNILEHHQRVADQFTIFVLLIKSNLVTLLHRLHILRAKV